MKGLIINNAYNTSLTYINQSARLKQEFDKLNVAVDVRSNDFFPVIIKGGNVQSFVEKYDFCVYLDKDKYVSRLLENSGLRVFNRTDAMEVCDDKMSTHIALAGEIPMPTTLPGLLCYDEKQTVHSKTADKIIAALGLPIIVKQSYGSLGAGVYKADDKKMLLEIMEKVKCVPHLFQEYIDTSFGKDVRVIVIGNKVCASMLRVSQGDFRSNAECGGVGQQFALPPSYASLCVRLSKVLNLDYCGIDILLGKEGKPLLCEVNSNAFWGTMEKVTQINVAKTYALHILNSLGK